MRLLLDTHIFLWTVFDLGELLWDYVSCTSGGRREFEIKRLL